MKNNKKTPLILIFILIFIFLPFFDARTTTSQTYYIDNTCSDANVGSATVDGSTYDPVTPACTGGSDKYYATIADINAAAATLSPGDTISFRKGLTWNEQLTIPESGTSGNVYTFNSFGTGNKPIIDGQNTRDHCITGSDKEYIAIDGLQCQNTLKAGIRFVTTVNKTNFVITNVTINLTGEESIYFDAQTDDTISNITITNNTISSWGQVNNTVGIWLADGTYSNAYIGGNTIAHGSESNGVNRNTPDGILVTKPNSVTIEKNIINNGIGHGIVTDSSPPAVCGSNNIVRFNYVHDTGDDSFWFYGCTNANGIKVYGNIATDPGDDCFDIDSGDAYIANNTCINSIEACFDLGHSTQATSGTIYNNVCIFDIAPFSSHNFIFLQGVGQASDFTFDNNIYYDSTGTYTNGFYSETDFGAGSPMDSFANWQALGSTPDAHSMLINPQLGSTPYYYPASNSPANNKGLYLGSSIQLMKSPITWITGITGVTLGSRWDIGAYYIKDSCQ